MTLPRNIFFIRHGESEGNVASNQAKLGDFSLYTDEFMTTPGRKWNLTEKGRAQAELTGEWLQKEIDSLKNGRGRRHYVSPYLRTKQTAALLGLTENGKSAEWYLNRTLRERDWGDIDAIPKKQFEEDPIYKLNALKKKTDPLYWRPPGGESIQDVAENRVRNFLDTLHRECGDQTIVAVAHGEFMKAIRIILERADDEVFEKWESSKKHNIRNCEINQYSKENQKSSSSMKVPGTRLQFIRRIYPSLEENRMIVGKWKYIKFTRPTNEQLLMV